MYLDSVSPMSPAEQGTMNSREVGEGRRAGETSAVVADGQKEMPRAELDSQVDVAGLCVTLDVAERFLGDAKHGYFSFRREAERNPDGVDHHRCAGGRLRLAREDLEGGEESQILEVDRAQSPNDAAQLIEQAGGQLPELGQARDGGRRLRWNGHQGNLGGLVGGEEALPP